MKTKSTIITIAVLCTILALIFILLPNPISSASIIDKIIPNNDYKTSFIRLLKNCNYTLSYRTSTAWIDCTNRLTISYRIINEQHRKFSVDFDSFTFYADYKINVTINNVDEHLLDTSNKTLILYMSYGDIIGFNYSDIASIPNLILSHSNNDTVFSFSMQRNHIRNIHINIDPSYFIVSCYNGESTWYNSQRLIARSHNGTIFMSSYNETTTVIYKNFNNGSSTWVLCSSPSVGFDGQPYKLIMTRNNSLWAFWSKGNNINYSISLDFGATWSTEKRINNGSFVSYDPSVCLDSLNNIHLVFYGHIGGSYWQLSYFKYNYTTGWSTVTLLTTYAVSGVAHNQNPSIACSLNNSIAVAYREGSNYIKCALYYGNAWHLRIEVYHTAPTLRAQNIPCVIFDQNNMVCIVWAGRYDITTTHLRISYSTSTDWITFSTPTTISSYNLYQYTPSIGCSLDNEKYVAWGGRDGSGNAFRHILYTYTIGGVWQPVTSITAIDGYNDYDANILYGNNPRIDGLSITNPNTGFCMIFSEDKNITFYASSNLNFHVHKVSNVTLYNWYPINNTLYDIRYIKNPMLWFNITVNDDVSYTTKIKIWVDNHLIYTSGWGFNRTESVNISSFWYCFNFTLDTFYNFTVNGTDSQGYYKNETHTFSYIASYTDNYFLSGTLILDDFLFLILYLFGILYLIINKNTNEMFVGSKLAYIFIFLNLALILGCIVTYTTPLQETIMTGLLFAYVFLLWLSYDKRKNK